MPRKRKLIGIYRRRAGWRVDVRVNGRMYTQHFELFTPIEEMKAWREEQIEKHHQPTPVERALQALKLIAWKLRQTQTLADDVVKAADADRTRADQLLAGMRGNQSKNGRLHALCYRLINDNARLAKQLASIRSDLTSAGIEPPTRPPVPRFVEPPSDERGAHEHEKEEPS